MPFAPAESETQVAVSDAVSLATRAITDVTFSTADSVTTVNVTFDAGAAGDNHALYVAYAPADMGAQLAGWTALQRVKIVGADETSLRLLPALPRAWTRGSVAGLRAPGGLRVDIEWGDSGWGAELSLDPSPPPRNVDAFVPGKAAPERIVLAPGGRAELSGSIR